jgi:hypothetical protein
MKLFDVFVNEPMYRASCLNGEGEPTGESIEAFCESIFGDDLKELAGNDVELTLSVLNGMYRIALCADDNSADETGTITEHYIATVDGGVFSNIETNEELKNFVLGKVSKEKVLTEIPTIIAAWHKATAASPMHKQPGALMPTYRLTDTCVVASIKCGMCGSTTLN